MQTPKSGGRWGLGLVKASLIARQVICVMWTAFLILAPLGCVASGIYLLTHGNWWGILPLTLVAAAAWGFHSLVRYGDPW
jgi:hypothetical protein